jgi:hypothetical protein
VLSGCDREVSHSEQVQTNPNGTVTDTTKDVSKDANGNTVVTKDQTTH